MNDINILVKIIDLLGGAATTEDIVAEYCKEYHMMQQPQYKLVVEKTLSNNKKRVRQNRANFEWELKSEEKTEVLYVNDNKYFKTIQEVMQSIFQKRVPLSQGYFKIDDDTMAWFPQPKNEDWENTLSEDGMFWYERPKKDGIDYTPDYKKRFVFTHENDGYRFTGLFIFNGIEDDRTRVYELIDDKVHIVKARPSLLICRVAYMKRYDGIADDDIPENGGSFVVENNDAAEKYNFHRYDDGNCYIYVETKYKAGHTGEDEFAKSTAIEQLNPSFKNKDSIDGVKVVLMAFSPNLNKNVVVGWYDNATVYRNRIIEPDKIYMIKCAYEDAHLIPDSERRFEVPGARGNAYGIGQCNFWYIQKNEAAKEYEQSLIDYLAEVE